MHRLALLPCLRLHRGRMGLMGLGLMLRSRGVSLPLLPGCWACSLVEPLAKLPWSHGLAGVSTDISIRTLSHPRSHGSILGLITRVLASCKPRNALLVLVGVWRLSGGGVWVSGCVAHVGIALGLCLGLGVSHLGPPHSNMSQVVRWVLSRRGCHALWRVVLVNASCIGCRWALHPTIVSLRHLVAPHLVGAGPGLCWGLLIS